MKRGGYGSPYRPLADGWSNPRKLYFGGLYQHQNKNLNHLVRYQNTTDGVPLQPGQAGPPMTRPAPNTSGPGGCETHFDNGLPKVTWVGCGPDQYLPPCLGGPLVNNFTQNGTNDLGKACRQRGAKWVQAYVPWNGMLPLTSHDDNLCATFGGDVDCGSSRYESYQPTPAQVKYLTLDVDWKMSGGIGYDYMLKVFNSDNPDRPFSLQRQLHRQPRAQADHQRGRAIRTAERGERGRFQQHDLGFFH
jgi:hypothetical protein